MTFTCMDYVLLLAATFALYWALPKVWMQNLLIICVSYYFYGCVHPWFCILLAISTLVAFFCAKGMKSHPEWKKTLLLISLICDLGMLAFFKYFNFFMDNVQSLMETLHLPVDQMTLRIFLPVGISFYTFKTLGYIIDVYRDEIEPCKRLVDFASFVSFFPQLVAGPIERAHRFLPQMISPRVWSTDVFLAAWPLLLRGYMKKLIIADNVAVFVNKVFMLDAPSMYVLLAGVVAFTVQILADFSAYTDIARGSARLLGFELIENFKSPYLAISPSDFWRRWHISFSSWIRDYLYIPLGGSKVTTWQQHLRVVVLTMGLSGFWHGAAWNFILWGVYHGLLVFFYHRLGMGGRWQPRKGLPTFVAWACMLCFTLFGWLLFRIPSFHWLLHTLASFHWGLSGDSLVTGSVVMALVGFYTLVLFGLLALDRWFKDAHALHAAFYGLALAAILIYAPSVQQDFIYFQF